MATPVSSRRKACDLCVSKKIKCDGTKPICSNCVLYQTECTTSAARRDVHRRRKSTHAVRSKSPSGDTNNLEARLVRVENQLSLPSSSASGAFASTSNIDAPPTEAETAQNQSQKDFIEAWNFDLVQPSLYSGSQRSLHLPPREEIQPVIEGYFSSANVVIPLFDQQSFMRILDDWYDYPATQNRARCAAIQIVLALGLWTAEPDARAATIRRAKAHLNNAQSVLPELVIRDEDLLGIQVLLGIAILFQNSSDQRPTSIIIASAITLSNRLGLHSNTVAQTYRTEEALQRSRVFWIAFTLDKELCIRIKSPSIQNDADIDLPMPPTVSPDGAGILQTPDGRSEIDYFRLRIEIAHIKGKIYDLLYSNRSASIKCFERQQRIVKLQIKLNEWYERIPPAFQIEYVASVLGPGGLVQMTKLYHGYLIAELMTHGLYSHDAEWLRCITYGTSVKFNDVVQIQDQFGAARENTAQDPPSASGWEKLVHISRGCMKLFFAASKIECLAWQCSCGHFSALFILLANMYLHPSNSYVSLDQYLCSKAIDIFDRIIELVPDKAFLSVRRLVEQLEAKANAAVGSSNVHGKKSTTDSFQNFNAEWDIFEPPNKDWTFDDEGNIFIDSFPNDRFDTTWNQRWLG